MKALDLVLSDKNMFESLGVSYNIYNYLYFGNVFSDAVTYS